MSEQNIVDKITKIIGLGFRSFGGGQGSRFNPITEALKDKPFQFAAGVDIKPVVEAVLFESGHDDLLAVCEKLVKFCESKERWNQDDVCPVDAYESAKAVLAKVKV